MRLLRPWAPKAPSITEEAPERQPTSQKGEAIVDAWEPVAMFGGRSSVKKSDGLNWTSQ